LPQVWETESAGIFNLTECVEKGEIKCAQYWPDGIDETEVFILGDDSKIFVTRIDKDPLQMIIDDIEKGLSNETSSSKARETTRFRNAIADKKMFEIRTFELKHSKYGDETREVTQYHVKSWKDNTGLLGDGHDGMRDFLHFLVEQVDTQCRNMATGPPIIHCR
jgi:protein tyrosine phosphatase